MYTKYIKENLEFFNSKSDCEIYAVGGAVRDFALGKEITKDLDLIFKGPESKLVETLDRLELEYKKIDPTSGYPIYQFMYNGYIIEISLPRKEKKINNSENPHKNFEMEFSENISLKEDALRRDFTINALYMDKLGNILDPLKNGLDNLKHKLLVPCSIAFLEDPLRIFRALRFSSSGFIISYTLLDLISNNSEYLEKEINNLPVERLTGEFVKSLKCENYRAFFYNFMRFNLDIKKFNFIRKMNDIPAGPKQFHGTNSVLEHSLGVMDRLKYPHNRLYALMHDYGKIFTSKDVLPHHYGHDKVGEEEVVKLLESLRFPRKEIDTASFVARYHMGFGGYSFLRDTKKIQIIKEAMKLDCIGNFIDVVQADSQSFTRDNEIEVFKIMKILKTPASQIIDFDKLKDSKPSSIGQRVFQTRLSLIREEIKRKD